MRGHLFENMIISDFIKNKLNKGESNNLSFYRDSNGNEVDLLIPTTKGYKAIEIKSSATYHTDFEKGLKSVSDTLASKIKEKYIIYNGEMENEVADIKLINWKNKKYVILQ